MGKRNSFLFLIENESAGKRLTIHATATLANHWRLNLAFSQPVRNQNIHLTKQHFKLAKPPKITYHMM